MKFEMKYPLFKRKWKWIAITFFPLPFVIMLLSILLAFDFPQESVGDFFYLCWAIGFTILNFTEEKEEDEMIEQLRLKSFTMGVFYLMWGLTVLGMLQFFSFGSLFTDFMSAYLAIWLLNTYIFLSFTYYKWQNR
ncbi:hypothetical protein [Marivirga harenae]|uniref:hypothetical protein n=1 Tax=Marivirga harenae TaxID=2010992 RepID=UPI0026DF4022|nr:hypothetical protein [Marivirga harenae]WKV11477.1 hypothetical protein Q3Y49_14820 [Marivirga harenae]